MSIDPSLKQYIETVIIPQYDHFDAAHRRDHAQDVIDRSLELAKHYEVNINMVYAIAAFHDTGLCEGRETHHVVSGRIIRKDAFLKHHFTEQEIETMAQAAEDHRASADHEPRSIYGKIVSEADRIIIPHKIIMRTIQYGLSHYPELGKEAQYQRFKEHMLKKYSEHGYIKLWLPESENAPRLLELQEIIRNEAMLKNAFNSTWDEIEKA